MNRTCEMLGCMSSANKLYSLAPGTNLLLCKGCAEAEGLEDATTGVLPEILGKPHETEMASEQRCRHHWIIQPADGPVSWGVCKLCRETREFKNSLDTWEWDSADFKLRSAPVTDSQEEE